MIRRPPRSTLFPLHDALPISLYFLLFKDTVSAYEIVAQRIVWSAFFLGAILTCTRRWGEVARCFRVRALLVRSEEHTSELQSHLNLVCRLLLEKKKSISLTHH